MNPAAIADAIGPVLVALLSRPDVRDALRGLLASDAPASGLADVHAAARALTVSPSTVRRLGKQHPAAVVGIGRSRRYDLSRLREALAARDAAPAGDGEGARLLRLAGVGRAR